MKENQSDMYIAMLEHAVQELESDLELRLSESEFFNTIHVSHLNKSHSNFTYKNVHQAYDKKEADGFTFLYIEDELSNKYTFFVAKKARKGRKHKYSRINGRKNVLNSAIEYYDNPSKRSDVSLSFVSFKDVNEPLNEFLYRSIVQYLKNQNVYKQEN